jgi:hypothetical protein
VEDVPAARDLDQRIQIAPGTDGDRRRPGDVIVDGETDESGCRSRDILQIPLDGGPQLGRSLATVQNRSES